MLQSVQKVILLFRFGKKHNFVAKILSHFTDL